MKKAESNGPAILIFIVVLLIFSSVIGGLVYFFWEDLFPPSDEAEDDKKTPSPSNITADEPQAPSPYDLSSLSPLTVVPGGPSGPSGTPGPEGPSGPGPSGPSGPSGGKCIGFWGPCSATCLTDGQPAPTQRFVITNPGDGLDGNECRDSDDNLIIAGVNDTKICSTLPDCGRNCKGSWGPWSTCSSTCGQATKRKLFTIAPDGEPTPGGKACSVDHGPFADQGIEEASCVIGDAGYTKTVCDAPVDCVGEWKDTGCTKSCGGGQVQQRYEVSVRAQPDAQGNVGKACKDETGQVRLDGDRRTTAKACNSIKCCDMVNMASWIKHDIDCDNGTVGGLPVVTWTRAVLSRPDELLGQDITDVCGYPVAATSYSSAAINAVLACQPRLPISGKCSNGGNYSSATGCSLPVTTATGIQCPFGETGSTSGTGPNSDFARELAARPDINWTGTNVFGANKVLDYNISGSSSAGCIVNYSKWDPGLGVGSVAGSGSVNIMSKVTSATCPNGYTRSGTTCNPPITGVTDLQCPTLFQSKNFSTNRCESSSATGSGQPGASDSRPTMVALGTLAPDAELGF